MLVNAMLRSVQDENHLLHPKQTFSLIINVHNFGFFLYRPYHIGLLHEVSTVSQCFESRQPYRQFGYVANHMSTCLNSLMFAPDPAGEKLSLGGAGGGQVRGHIPGGMETFSHQCKPERRVSHREACLRVSQW